MGKDELFRKRKARQTAELERVRKERAQGSRYLIVCEGSKTEPNYFGEFCRIHRLLTSRVSIAPSDGSSPDRVVDHAKMLYLEDVAVGSDSYDQVFCVFDQDKHPSYQGAVKRIEELKAHNKPFVAITSVPCFEYWLLLHFIYTRRSFHATDGRSICNAVVYELRKQPGFNSYEKGQKGIYSLLQEKTSIAIINARQAELDARKTSEENPSTRVHILVLELHKLMDRRR